MDQTFSREGIKPFGIEGLEGLAWVLMDYSDFILHIFREETRMFYDLEHLWADAPRIALSPEGATTVQGKIVGEGGFSFSG